MLAAAKASYEPMLPFAMSQHFFQPQYQHPQHFYGMPAYAGSAMGFSGGVEDQERLCAVSSADRGRGTSLAGDAGSPRRRAHAASYLFAFRNRHFPLILNPLVDVPRICTLPESLVGDMASEMSR
jgi:hypothetical protein